MCLVSYRKSLSNKKLHLSLFKGFIAMFGGAHLTVFSHLRTQFETEKAG